MALQAENSIAFAAADIAEPNFAPLHSEKQQF